MSGGLLWSLDLSSCEAFAPISEVTAASDQEDGQHHEVRARVDVTLQGCLRRVGD